VIGYLEPHDRPETAAQAEGLEMVPRRIVEYGTARLPDMDLEAILRRAPELALIDELAHTNARGMEFSKRYMDVEEMLVSGIDVISTVNVQHLESLNDQIADLTGVRVRETLPDSVLTRADEVVLIDLTPEDLIARLREGKVYAEDRIGAALNSFFKVEYLSTLREIALRQVAEEVESRRLSVAEPLRDRDRLCDPAKSRAYAEHLLALVTPGPASQRLIRRAWRSAQRLGADLDLLWVAPAGTAESDETPEVAAMERLAAVLGARLIVETSDEFVMTVKRVAGERGATYVLLGPPRPRTGTDRFRPPLIDALLEAMPGVDVRIVTDPNLRENGSG